MAGVAGDGAKAAGQAALVYGPTASPAMQTAPPGDKRPKSSSRSVMQLKASVRADAECSGLRSKKRRPGGVAPRARRRRLRRQVRTGIAPSRLMHARAFVSTAATGWHQCFGTRCCARRSSRTPAAAARYSGSQPGGHQLLIDADALEIGAAGEGRESECGRREYFRRRALCFLLGT